MNVCCLAMVHRKVEDCSSSLVGALCPAGVAVAEVFSEDGLEALFPEEERAVATAFEKRRREFIQGRTCARRALRQLGYDGLAVPVGSGREPVWPRDVVGSITHCRGFTGAAVAREAQVSSIGIDAELDEPLPHEIIDLVALRGEQEWLGVQDDPGWDRVLFSAKESTYKAWYPVARRWLGFEDAFVRFNLDDASFTAEILLPKHELNNGPAFFEGRFRRTEDLVLTVAVPVY